jgi:DNA mismatch endonuclease (patch repair protein)
MEFWDKKVADNRLRDMDTTARLLANGWTVLRYWEHQSAVEVAEDVMATVERSGVGLRVGRICE